MREVRFHILFLGLILIALGVLLLLHTREQLDFWELLERYWPLVIILAGIYVLLHAFSPWGALPHVEAASEPPGTGLVGDAFLHHAVWGDIKLVSEATAFRGGSVHTVFGDVELDLSRADIAPGEQKLEVSSTFGEVTLRVKPGTPVAVRATTVLGDVDVFGQKRSGLGPGITYQSPDYAQAEAKLAVWISQVAGDITVR
ncbi:MAG: cell wall-active antibiotics response protein LiaF [bacterium]|jgi:predicted membrane protein|nr:cell wall-active antibiotics response protein LiaF [candidate division KSB1 bacterium]MDH7560253.1 cell wall-active antibiotics response protein LiaF [bacterium]